jgi:hypothetical protein
LLSDDKDAPPITSDLRAETLQDQIDPSRISAVIYQAAQRRKLNPKGSGEPGEEPITKQQARQALMVIDPQTVIESILSREWGNRDEHARWRAGQLKLRDALGALPLISETEAYPESVLYRKLNNELAKVPGAVASPMSIRNTYHELTALPEAISRLKSAPGVQKGPATPAERWTATLELVILNQELFNRWRLQMETSLSELSAVSILKPEGLEQFYKGLNKKAPESGNLVKHGWLLVGALSNISELHIEGEPSDRNNLDTKVLADKARLGEMLAQVMKSAQVEDSDIGDEHSGERVLKWALEHADEFRQMIDLARAYCDAQNQAFLNKLSRAFQKPDFCIRRDAVCDSCDELLPLSLSWDEDWYYGRNADEVPAGWPPPSPATGSPVKGNRGQKRIRKRAKA